MQKSIAEAEDWIDKKVAQQTERIIQAVHQRLDIFELRFLARPAPTIDFLTIQADVASLRADVDAISNMRMPKPEAAPAKLAQDTMLATLFTTTTTPPHPAREHDKSYRYRESEETHSRKN